MRQLILNIQDSDMRALERMARDREIRPEQLITDGLKLVVASKRISSLLRYRQYRGKITYAKGAASTVKMLYTIKAENRSTPHQVEQAITSYTMDQQPTRAAPDNAAEERARRRALLSQTAGMWKHHADSRADGVQYQAEVRAEWD